MSALFDIRHRPDLSLQYVVDQAAAGFPVIRSPHAGNWYPSNLTVAALGIRCLVTNTMVCGRDYNYHPSGIVVGRSLRRGIGPTGMTLVAQAKVRRSPGLPGLDEYFPVGSSLMDGHLRGLRKAVPQAHIFTLPEYLTGQADVAAAILETCADVAPQLWHRRTLPQGGFVDIQKEVDGESTSNRAHRLASQPQGWADVGRYGVFGFDSADRGWLIPKEVFVVLTAVLDAMAYGTTDVYHVSGPGMLHYIDSLGETLQTLFGACVQRLSVPQTLRFHMVPGGYMTLGAPRRDNDLLDRLVHAYLELTRRSKPDEPLKSAARSRFGAGVELSWLAAGWPMALDRPRDARFCSQYDLLTLNDEWYSSPWGLKAPLGEVRRLVIRLARSNARGAAQVPEPATNASPSDVRR